MKITVTLDDALHREVKAVAAASGLTMTAVIEDAVRESMARRGAGGRKERVTLPTSGGKGIRPGVDLYNSAELLDLMDEYDGKLRRCQGS